MLTKKAKATIEAAFTFRGLNGAAIEPLVPLLTFIGNIDLDKTIEKNIPANYVHKSSPTEKKPDKKEEKRCSYVEPD